VQGDIWSDLLNGVTDPEGIAQVAAMQMQVCGQMLNAMLMAMNDPMQLNVLLMNQIVGQVTAGKTRYTRQ
jgi:hypothetical protein